MGDDVLSNNGMSRRQFLAALAGTTMAVGASSVLGPLARPAAAAAGDGPNGRLVPTGKVGIQMYTIRSVVRSRTASDPGNVGEILTTLSDLGFRNIEFFGNYHGYADGDGPHELRRMLDDLGLQAIGAHRGLNDFRNDMPRQLEIANILGMPHLGTANAPTNTRTVEAYKAAAAEFNAWGAQARAAGIKLYQHNHQHEFAFGNDQPDVRLYDVFLEETDPELVFLEMDIYWAFVGQHLYPGFDPASYVRANPQRYPLFHAKDGERRPDLNNGYNFTEFGAGDIDFRSFFRSIGPKGNHYSLYEQDNAGSTPPSAGGALGAASRSAEAILNLRG